ncbi:TIGR00341 family protein [Psychrobacter fulvigenes]|uniref:TIGR00341 family protein n=1 Tax=Psychrobacter fulvigenes TaxID=533323 RepID=UPI001917F2C4|nr:TIGR00341 family protein [Psychrobacter fulvigenes]
MTSSNNHSPDSLSKQHPLDNADHTNNNEATTEPDTQTAQEPLTDPINNLSAKSAEKNKDNKEETDGEESTEREDQKVETDCAQHPESEVTITSPSPDVVIATVETPDVEDLVHEDIKAEQQNHSASTSSEVTTTQQNNSKDNDTQATHTENDSVNEGQSDNNTDSLDKTNSVGDEVNQSESNQHSFNEKEHAKKQSLTSEDGENEEYLDDEEKQEAVEKQKEAKLESYKQFVAEQFSHQKVDYPEVRVKIEANALPSKMYFVMNILSAIIASYGLVTNSAAVVIGAMLVAMMLGPITGIALAIIDHRAPLLRKSLFTVIAGVSLVVLVGFLVGWLHKEQPLTAEILSRTQPTSMDLMIALAGGTAGAYAMVSPHLSVAVVGVAVATALVPPLAASGILFANGETQLGLGALLLAITNIIAIQFTNALVLWVLGFRRLVDDDYKSSNYLTFLRRNAVTLLLLVGLGIYLSYNLNKNANQQTFENSIKTAINNYFIDKGNVLTNTQFDNTSEHLTIRAVIQGETTPSSYDVRQIEAIISKDMADSFATDTPIKLQLRYFPVQVIEADPLTADKLDKTDAAILTN